MTDSEVLCFPLLSGFKRNWLFLLTKLVKHTSKSRWQFLKKAVAGVSIKLLCHQARNHWTVSNSLQYWLPNFFVPATVQWLPYGKSSQLCKKEAQLAAVQMYSVDKSQNNYFKMALISMCVMQWMGKQTQSAEPGGATQTCLLNTTKKKKTKGE